MANLTNYRILLSRPGGAAFQSGEIVRGIVVFDIQDGPALQNIPLLRLIVRGTSCINLGGDSDEDEIDNFFEGKLSFEKVRVRAVSKVNGSNRKPGRSGHPEETGLPGGQYTHPPIASFRSPFFFSYPVSSPLLSSDGAGASVTRELHHTKPQHFQHPFFFTLPARCPSSYDEEEASISYSLTAEFYPTEGWQYHQDCWLPFTVVSLLNVSSSKYLTSFSASSRATTDCCATPYKSTSLEIQTDRQGFLPGETLYFDGTLINGSAERLKTFIKLCQEIVYNSLDSEDQEAFTVRKNVKKIQVEDILPCSKTTWSGQGIRIPTATSPSILNCHAFKITYFAEVSLRNNVDHRILSVKIPITIGTPHSHPQNTAPLLRADTNPSIVPNSSPRTNQDALPPPRVRRFSRANTSPQLLPPRAVSPGPPAYDDLSIHPVNEDVEETPPAYDDCIGGLLSKSVSSVSQDILPAAPLQTIRQRQTVKKIVVQRSVD